MKNPINIAFAMILTAIIAISCTDNGKARQYGGETEVKLKPGERLVIATWKESNLWYLTEPMPADYQPQTKIFRENSQFGVWEGTVKFIESK